MSKQKCFLVCNAHLDPVWLWPWEDGMVEAISTFRVAAEFCEEHPEFVFNHNESVLYEWVEEHDPPLFARIQKLVAAGRWHIAGGAYLQPDPIGASGESMIRQYLVGQSFFREKFDVQPTTAYNFDSFGHPRGLIQVLAGCGFDSYVFCRPGPTQAELPIGAFLWQHPSGAQVWARRSDDHYITQGALRSSMKDGNWPEHYRKAEGDFMFLWGIGNHGGGPSRDEYAQLPGMRADFPDVEFIESTPDAFFERTRELRSPDSLPVYAGDLKPLSQGCYTSMFLVKQAHRRMENRIALAETICTQSWWRGKGEYPVNDLAQAWKDILFCEFHDILPGSGIPSVERDALVRIGHCEELLRRNISKAMIQLLRDEPLAERNRTPLFVFNPHAWKVTAEVEIEYCLDQQFGPDSVVRFLSSAGEPVSAQFEKGENNLTDKNWGEWRQKAVFLATLPPLSYQRFDTDYEVLPPELVTRWKTPTVTGGNQVIVAGGEHDVAVSLKTGLIDKIAFRGVDVLLPNSCKSLILPDSAHSWETLVEWRDPVAEFKLATPAQAAAIKGSPRTNPTFTKGNAPVSIIEDGPIRTIVEAIFVYDGSYIVQRYVISKVRPIVHIDMDVFWNEHDRLLKLQVLHNAALTEIEAEACYSIDDQTATVASGDESDCQHFLRLSSTSAGSISALGVIPYGTTGYSHRGNNLRMSVLRSPAYSCMDDVPADFDRFHNRYIPRQDQGLRNGRFTLVFGDIAATKPSMVRAAWENSTPLAPFVYFPTNRENQPKTQSALVTVDTDNVLLVAMKKAQHGEALILRFWETAGLATKFEFIVAEKSYHAEIPAHGLRTWRIGRDGSLAATDLLEL